MNIRQRFNYALMLCAVVAAVVAAAPEAMSQATDTEPTPTPSARLAETTVYGLHTLKNGQSLRLSVVNAALNEPPEPGHDGEGEPPEPVRTRRVTLAFDIYAAEPPDPGHAGDGSVRNLRLVRRISRTFRLRPGDAAALDYEATRNGEIVGAWMLGQPPEPIQPGEAQPPDPIRTAVVTSLEVRQGNSTQMVLPGTTRGFNPQPDPPSER